MNLPQLISETFTMAAVLMFFNFRGEIITRLSLPLSFLTVTTKRGLCINFFFMALFKHNELKQSILPNSLENIYLSLRSLNLLIIISTPTTSKPPKAIPAVSCPLIIKSYER